MNDKERFRLRRREPQVDAEYPLAEVKGAIKTLQKVEKYYVGADEIWLDIPHNRPVLVHGLSDAHLGSLSTNQDSIDEMLEFVCSNEDIKVVLLGDLIEGIKQAYLRTNVTNTPLNFHQQILYARNYVLKPLAERGKILTMVSDHFGHEGWADQGMTMSPWMVLIDGLGVELLANRGLMHLRYKNGHTKTFQLFHNVPGRSAKDPLHGLTKLAMSYSGGSGPDVVMSAHTHRAAVGVENSPGGSITMVQSATHKGVEGFSDPLGVAAGWKPADPYGQGVVIQARRRYHGSKRSLPVETTRHGEVALKAISLLDSTERQGLTNELLEEIKERVEKKPVTVFDSRRSKKVKDPLTANKHDALRKKDYADQWRRMKVRIKTRLPIHLSFIANTRLGGNSADAASLKKVTDGFIGSHEHRLAVLLGNIIDSDVSTDPDRERILEESALLFAGIKERVVALMLDGHLRDKSWKKNISRGKYGEPSRPIAAGTKLARLIGDIPLIDNLSTIEFFVGDGRNRPRYSGVFMDHLSGRGSTEKSTFGLRSVYQAPFLSCRPGFMAGGHMPLSGVATVFDGNNSETHTPHFIAPGWLSHSADWGSKSNPAIGSHGGLGIIMMPGTRASDYLSLPTSSLDESRYLHEATLLLFGLEEMGKLDDVLKARGR